MSTRYTVTKNKYSIRLYSASKKGVFRSTMPKQISSNQLALISKETFYWLVPRVS